MNATDYQREMDRLVRERDAFAASLAHSNAAFVEKVKEFSIIKRISESLTWGRDKRYICTEIVDLIIDETTAENCSLWLLSPDKTQLYLTAVRSQELDGPKYFGGQELPVRTLEMGTGAAGWVARHGRSLLLEDATESAFFVQLDNAIPTVRSLLCLPIKCSSGVIGVLNLSHPDIGAFSRENERVLQLIIDQAGIVFTNYLLYNEIQELNRDLESRVEERTRTLRLSEERYARAIVAGKVGVWDWTLASNELYAAQNLLSMLGFSAGEMKSSPRAWLRLFHPDDRRTLLRQLSQVLNRKVDSYEGEMRMYRKDGSQCWFFVRCALTLGEGEIVRLSGSNTDIDQRKLAELQLAKAQEEALHQAHAAGKAEFANTVLHNIGNVLNSVNVASSQMRTILAKSKQPQLNMALQLMMKNSTDLARFLTETDKGRQLMEYLVRVQPMVERDFLELDRISNDLGVEINLMKDIIETQQTDAKSKEYWEMRDLGRLLEESLKIQWDSINRNQVSVRKRFDAAPVVWVPVARVIHVLINLIKNAVEAMEGVAEDKRTLSLDIRDEGSEWAVVCISDNGYGMDEATAAKLFAHGFTTKDDGHGFGLHYCQKTMEEIYGRIEAKSEGLGRGARFELFFSKKKPLEAGN